MSERTLAIIKPDAVAQGIIGEVIARLSKEGLKVIALKMVSLTKEKAQGFYAVHCERPFFDSLTDFMSSGPCVVMILEGDGAILKWRTIMGATDPAKADPGTIRKDFASNVEQNCVHGSDAPETAAQETEYFFNALEIHAY